jgi:hypothetical protein
MVIKFGLACLVVCSSLLVGCAATVKHSGDAPPVKVGANASKAIVLTMTGEKAATESGDWEKFKQIWQEAMQEEAAGIGASFVAQDTAPKGGSPGTLLAVNVVDFRLLSTGARVAFGIMTGNAFVNAQVSYRDLDTGQVWGDRNYDTSSSTWQGVFSPMTDKQVHAICKEVVATISGRAN